ncbi:AAA family ATPase [Streptomyces sp. NPDC058374]|uniref:AAA family ATPase n=1 Tax=Streptomyces sp. NPDC058374 TaxID=3346466 RepID=UPI0036548373
MRLHRLRITAFGPFGGAHEVDFDALSAAGLFLLHGPTGAGKTSVLDAVCYALYGSLPGERTAAAQGTGLRSDHAAPRARAEVVLDLTVAGRRLEVTRQPAWERPKKRGAGTTLDKAQTWLREYDPATGAWRDLSRSHQETGEEITQLLGMSKEQFCQVVLLPQGDFARFLRADAEARGRLLGRLFDTRRFAAVEHHLAELRRAAADRVQEADRVLLAALQRMRQVAGEETGVPAPEAEPGEPGLAAAVLGWAANARSTLRERRTVARLALAAAEEEQAAARRALDEARELHRLQRHAEQLHRRQARLEATAGEHEEHVTRLARARKAAAVEGALDLRTAADQAHARTRRAEERARAALPAERTASAQQLAALARAAVEEVGALAAAHRAERRHAELAGELARVDQDEQADEALLAETADWLGRWETTRAALQREETEARDAATRADRLAALLGPARDRLAAARRRDALTADADRARAAALTAAETAAAAQRHWLALKETRLAHIAAELAERLTDGEPCEVCGATGHPRPATRAEGHVDQRAEDAALAVHRRRDADRVDAERALAAVREELAAATAAATTADVAGLEAETRRLTAEHDEARAAAERLHAVRRGLDAAEQEHERRLADRHAAERRAAARATLRDSLVREQDALAEELEQARGGASGVAERARQLEERATLLTEAADAARAAEESAARLKDADARLADAAYRAGFDTPEQAAAAVLDDAGHRQLQHLIDARQLEEAEVRSALADPATADAARREPAGPDAADDRARRGDLRLRAAAAAEEAAARDGAALDTLSRQATAEARRLGPLREEYDRVARLASLAAGTSVENERRMRLESYVLAARLEQVAAAATVRLHRMSGGRYTLVHTADRSGRGRSGLGLRVVDAWTGRERDTATLSGGETFFASLALALGLADVVTDEAGGVRLDTLFIDEGFGSLDDQTLDDVLDVLDSLRERDRSVGIVSHVADLRRRVHTQLEVVKGRDGSRLRVHGTGG